MGLVRGQSYTSFRSFMDEVIALQNKYNSERRSVQVLTETQKSALNTMRS